MLYQFASRIPKVGNGVGGDEDEVVCWVSGIDQGDIFSPIHVSSVFV